MGDLLQSLICQLDWSKSFRLIYQNKLIKHCKTTKKGMIILIIKPVSYMRLGPTHHQRKYSSILLFITLFYMFPTSEVGV